MSHLTMDFTGTKSIASRTSLAAQAAGIQGQDSGTQYSLTCINNSTAPWVFYVYQTMPNQPNEIFSLAWFASPYKIGVNSSITFKWYIDYSFVWGNSGVVTPGVSFTAGGSMSCDPASNNATTFSVLNNTPGLSPVTQGQQPGSLIISEDPSVPNGVFATGIGMSGNGTFVQQALQNTQQVYTPEPEYWIAAANQMQMGVVLAQVVNKAASFDFGPNVYSATATLGANNEWIIS